MCINHFITQNGHLYKEKLKDFYDRVISWFDYIRGGIVTMTLVGIVLLFLSIKKDYEPALLLANMTFDTIMEAKQIARLGLEVKSTGQIGSVVASAI